MGTNSMKQTITTGLGTKGQMGERIWCPVHGSVSRPTSIVTLGNSQESDCPSVDGLRGEYKYFEDYTRLQVEYCPLEPSPSLASDKAGVNSSSTT